jgi:hypothetical protein
VIARNASVSGLQRAAKIESQAINDRGQQGRIFFGTGCVSLARDYRPPSYAEAEFQSSEAVDLGTDGGINREFFQSSMQSLS